MNRFRPVRPVRHALACIAAGLALTAVAVAVWFCTPGAPTP